MAQPEMAAANALLDAPAAERFLLACNRKENDEHWASDDRQWVGRASMSERHRFLLLKPPAGLDFDHFNVLVMGVRGPGLLRRGGGDARGDARGGARVHARRRRLVEVGRPLPPLLPVQLGAGAPPAHRRPRRRRPHLHRTLPQEPAARRRPRSPPGRARVAAGLAAAGHVAAAVAARVAATSPRASPRGRDARRAGSPLASPRGAGGPNAAALAAAAAVAAARTSAARRAGSQIAQSAALAAAARTAAARGGSPLAPSSRGGVATPASTARRRSRPRSRPRRRVTGRLARTGTRWHGRPRRAQRAVRRAGGARRCGGGGGDEHPSDVGAAAVGQRGWSAPRRARRRPCKRCSGGAQRGGRSWSDETRRFSPSVRRRRRSTTLRAAGMTTPRRQRGRQTRRRVRFS